MKNKESILEKIDNLNEDIRKNELKKEELERELWILRGRNDYKDYIGKYVKHTSRLGYYVTYMKVKDFHCYERDSICRNFIDFVGNGFCIKNGAVDIHEEVHIRINSNGYDEKHNVKYNVGKCLDVVTEEEYNSVLKDAVRDIIDKCGENPTKIPVNYYDYIGKCIRF